MDNKETQRRAIKIAMDFEKSQKRKPKNISEKQSGNGYDIESGSRKIEVKGFSGNLPSRIVFNYYNYRAYKKNKNFWLYLVYNLKSRKPKFTLLNKKEMRGEEYVQFEVKLDKKKLTILDALNDICVYSRSCGIAPTKRICHAELVSAS